jgi:alanine racemase
MELRQAGIEAPVLVMADTLRANFPAMLDYKLTPAVQALDDLAVFDGLVRARGRWMPMQGTVSMDMTTIDATDVAGLQAGEAVELLGEGFDASDIAALTGTIPYDVLCKIHPRVKRIYV